MDREKIVALGRHGPRLNFEKFLINQEGKPVKRYSPGFLTADVAADVEALLEHGPDALG